MPYDLNTARLAAFRGDQAKVDWHRRHQRFKDLFGWPVRVRDLKRVSIPATRRAYYYVCEKDREQFYQKWIKQHTGVTDLTVEVVEVPPTTLNQFINRDVEFLDRDRSRNRILQSKRLPLKNYAVEWAIGTGLGLPVRWLWGLDNSDLWVVRGVAWVVEGFGLEVKVDKKGVLRLRGEDFGDREEGKSVELANPKSIQTVEKLIERIIKL